MTDLVAIVRATRASAKALERMQEHSRAARQWADHATTKKRIAAYQRACRDYERAQQTLADNPLTGDSK
jgi:hypothetical protein